MGNKNDLIVQFFGRKIPSKRIYNLNWLCLIFLALES